MTQMPGKPKATPKARQSSTAVASRRSVLPRSRERWA